MSTPNPGKPILPLPPHHSRQQQLYVDLLDQPHTKDLRGRTNTEGNLLTSLWTFSLDGRGFLSGRGRGRGGGGASLRRSTFRSFGLSSHVRFERLFLQSLCLMFRKYLSWSVRVHVTLTV